MKDEKNVFQPPLNRCSNFIHLHLELLYVVTVCVYVHKQGNVCMFSDTIPASFQLLLGKHF